MPFQSTTFPHSLRCNIPPLRPQQRRLLTVPVSFIDDDAILSVDEIDVNVDIEGPCQGQTQQLNYTRNLPLQFDFTMLRTYEAPPVKQRQVE